MKKLTIVFALILFVSGIKSVFAGDDDFKGTITYNITYSGGEMNEAMLAQMPKTMKMFFKGSKAKSVIQMGSMNQSTIMNSESGNITSLMDIMGQKFAYTTNIDEMMSEFEDMPKPEISYPDETKEIAGHTGKKVVIETQDPSTGEEIIITGYYTDKLGKKSMMLDNPIYKDIDGIMLEFSTPAQGMLMEFRAVEVDKKNISDKEFEVPEEYKQVTKEELENMFGG